MGGSRRFRLTIDRVIAPYRVFLIIKEGLALADIIGNIKVGDAVFDITDSGTNPVFIDLISESTEISGIVRLGLVSVVVDGDGKPRANVTARLRMNTMTAADLYNSLGALLHKNQEGKGKAN